MKIKIGLTTLELIGTAIDIDQPGSSKVTIPISNIASFDVKKSILFFPGKISIITTGKKTYKIPFSSFKKNEVEEFRRNLFSV